MYSRVSMQIWKIPLPAETEKLVDHCIDWNNKRVKWVGISTLIDRLRRWCFRAGTSRAIRIRKVFVLRLWRGCTTWLMWWASSLVSVDRICVASALEESSIVRFRRAAWMLTEVLPLAIPSSFRSTIRDCPGTRFRNRQAALWWPGA